MLVKIVTHSRFMPQDHNVSIHSCESVEMNWTVVEPDSRIHDRAATPEDWLRYEAFIDDMTRMGKDFQPSVPMDIEVSMTRADGTTKDVYLTRQDGNAIVYIMDDNGKTIDKRKFDWGLLASQLAEASQPTG